MLHIFNNRSSIEKIPFSSLISYDDIDFIRDKWVTEAAVSSQSDESLHFSGLFQALWRRRQSCQYTSNCTQCCYYTQYDIGVMRCLLFLPQGERQSVGGESSVEDYYASISCAMSHTVYLQKHPYRRKSPKPLPRPKTTNILK